MIGFLEILIILVLLGVLVLPVIVVAGILRGRPTRGGLSTDERDAIRDLHENLAQMDSRMESLETILSDRITEGRT